VEDDASRKTLDMTEEDSPSGAASNELLDEISDCMLPLGNP
jgi:hypothetical protein